MFSLFLAIAGAPEAFAQEAPAPGPQLTKPPELLTFVEAPFPASEVGRTGSVVLFIVIRDDGTVEDAQVRVSAGPAFDAAAVEAARQFVFSPAEVDGKPARIGIEYQYDFVEKVVAPTTGIFTGVVMDRDEKVPIPGVTVTLGDGRTDVTDEQGRFEFPDVLPATTVVTLEGERLTALQTEETFVAGEQLDTVYEVFLAAEGEEGDDMEILVVAPTIKRQAVSTEVAADEARKVPGTQGDVLRVVENLPGVARASLGTGALVVWGAAPEDTGVYVDGVPVPRLYHDGGLRSVVGSELVRSVELVPGGYGAAYGRGLGGLVSVSTNRFDEEVHGAVAADVYDTSAAVGGPLDERWTLAIAGRYGYVGPLLGTFYPDVEDYFPVPHYYDGQARLGAELRPDETLDLTVLFSSDSTARTAPNPDPAREASEDKDLAFERIFLKYARDVGDGSSAEAVLYTGSDRTAQRFTFGQVETAIATRTRMVGLRGSYRSRVSGALTVEGGLDAFVPWTDVTRSGSIAVPSREGDVRVFGQPPPDQISNDEYRVVNVSVAPFVEADLALLDDRVHLVPGLRVDPYARSVSRAFPQVGVSPSNGVFVQDLRAEPRLALRVAPIEQAYLTAAYGVYGQPPLATDLSASFGNPLLPSASARHYVLGVGVRPVEVLSIDVTGFLTRSEDLTMRNPYDQPARAQALVASGEGRTSGIQSMIRLDPWKGLFGWISYTLSESERRDALGFEWRPSDYDQRHVLSALGGLELESGLELGLRARVSSGFPRTEVLGAFHDDRRDLYEPVFGAHNAIRLPAFFQADARIAQHLELGESALDLSFEVQNLTNQANVEEYVYDADYGERSGIRGLPILPVLGVRWSF